jgi:hypothetical protein
MNHKVHHIKVQEICEEFTKTMEYLILTISQFETGQFNIVPFEGSWSAAQVCDHILRSVSGIPKILMGNSITPAAEPCSKVQLLKDIFLDFDTKMRSPEFILPGKEELNKFDILDRLAEVSDEIKRIIDSEELSLLCTDFPFPEIGELTRYEWICFVNFHTRRHTAQLAKIYKIIEPELKKIAI